MLGIIYKIFCFSETLNYKKSTTLFSIKVFGSYNYELWSRMKYNEQVCAAPKAEKVYL